MSGGTLPFKAGMRVRHRSRGFTATVSGIGTWSIPKPPLVSLYRDDDPNHQRLYLAEDLEVIKERPDVQKPKRYIYYEVKTVVKVDIDKQGWDSSCDETFGLARMTTHPKYDGILDKEDVGAHMISYRRIDVSEFERDKHRMFNEEGGI